MSQTTGLKRTTLDKYYTKKNVVQSCIELIKNLIPYSSKLCLIFIIVQQ